MSCLGRIEIETRNREEVPFSFEIVPRGLSVEEEPYTALYNATHLYSDQADHRIGIQRRLEFETSRLGA